MALFRKHLHLAALAVVLGAAFGPAASSSVHANDADIVFTRDELRGNWSSPERCRDTPSAVWVTVYGKSFCMRYYLSTAGGTGKAALVFLGGDEGSLQYHTWSPNMAFLTRYPDGDQLRKFDWGKKAEALSKQVSGPALVLARVGLDGSSGSHHLRGTLSELYVMNAALDAIKGRHGFEEFHLGGFSGGGTLVAGLTSLRRDIGCAVPGSGRLADVPMRKHYAPDAPFQTFDPMKGVPALAKNKMMRIIVITDPNDQQVTRDHQDKFVQVLRRAGGYVEQYHVYAPDGLHHATGAYVPTALTYCMQRKTPDELGQALLRIKQNLMGAQQKDEASNPAQRGQANTIRRSYRPSDVAS